MTTTKTPFADLLDSTDTRVWRLEDGFDYTAAELIELDGLNDTEVEPYRFRGPKRIAAADGSTVANAV